MEFSMQLQKILEKEYGQANRDVQNIIDKLADKGVKILKQTSPKRSGKYAKNWTKTKEGKITIIHNKQGQLTHLLEHGHLTRNRRSRTRAFPHIKPVEEMVKKEYPKMLKEKFEK